MAKSNYLEDALLNHVLRAVAYTSPTAIYVGLFTAVADEEVGTVTEVSGGGYARVAATFSAPVDGITSNSATVTFVQPSIALGTVTHFGLFDAAAAGNLLYSGALAESFSYATNVQPEFPAGTLQVTED